MFDNLVVLSVDGQALIDAYVQVSRADANWPEGARNMGKNDIWIAATAVNAGLPLLTTDKDFRFLHDNLLQVLWIDPELKNHSIN
jgi:tRNA(fMet)-specific endonuclease VapC